MRVITFFFLFLYCQQIQAQEFWQPLNPDTCRIKKLTEDDSGILYVIGNSVMDGQPYHGVYSSADRGESWSNLNLEVSMKNPLYEIFIYQGIIFIGYEREVPNYASEIDRSGFRSTDKGKTWEHFDLVYKDTYSGALSFAADDNGVIYVAGNDCMYKSLDLGKTWEQCGAFPYSYSLGLDDKFLLYAGNDTTYYSSSAGIFAISNSCNSVFPLTLNGYGLTYPTGKVYRNSRDVLFSILYSDFIRSTDRGATWTNIRINNNIQGRPFFDNDLIYLLTGDNGLFISSDDGDSWSIIHPNASFQENCFFIYLSKNGDLYGFNGYRLFRSKDKLLSSGVNSIMSISQEQLLSSPNPVSDNLNIDYFLLKPGNSRIIITSLLGERIVESSNNELTQGWHSVRFDCGNFTSGIYFCQLVTDGQVITKKIIKK